MFSIKRKQQTKKLIDYLEFRWSASMPWRTVTAHYLCKAWLKCFKNSLNCAEKRKFCFVWNAESHCQEQLLKEGLRITFEHDMKKWKRMSYKHSTGTMCEAQKCDENSNSFTKNYSVLSWQVRIYAEKYNTCELFYLSHFPDVSVISWQWFIGTFRKLA